MTKLIYYPTVVGIFYICRGSGGVYHPCIEEEVLGSYETLVDAIEGIAYDTSVILPHPEMGDPLDPTDLGVPDDISGWRPVE